MQQSIRTIFKQVRPEKCLTTDALRCIADHIETFVERLVHNQPHLSLFSVKDKMDKIVHPLQKDAIEKELEKSFYKYYQDGIKNDNISFSVNAVKKLIKNEVETCCYTDLLYIATCLDYLCLEICELAGKFANNERKVRVSTEHVDDAIGEDEALSYTFKVNKRKRSRKK